MPEAGGSAARNKILIDPHAPKFLVSTPGSPSRLFWAGVHSFFINHFDVRHSAGKEDNMIAKIIDPRSWGTVRLIQDANDLEDCLLKVQEDQGEPLVLQFGDSGKMIHMIPC